MVIDNFEAIRSHLLFSNDGDIYAAQVMLRKKDNSSSCKKTCIIKTYYIVSLEDYDRKVPEMKDLASHFGARVYVMMSRKNRLCLNRILAQKMVAEIDNANLSYDSLMSSAVCGCHISDRKYWVIDIDDDMCETGTSQLSNTVRLLEYYTERISALVKEAGGDTGKIFSVPTPHGFHLMTPPFNKMKTGLGDRIKTDAMTLAFYDDSKCQDKHEDTTARS